MSGVSSAGFRLRVTYAKSGRCRFLSHLEVTRALERTCRRAGLPYAVTQGFSPRIKMAFGPALPVGTGGLCEAFDVWLTRYVPPATAAEALARVSAPELMAAGAAYVDGREASLTAGSSVARYLVETEEVDARTLREALGAQVRTGELRLEHQGKTKVFDLPRVLPKEPWVEVGEDGEVRAHLTVLIGPDGSLRPETLVLAALSSIGAPGIVTRVTRTEILRP